MCHNRSSSTHAYIQARACIISFYICIYIQQEVHCWSMVCMEGSRSRGKEGGRRPASGEQLQRAYDASSSWLLLICSCGERSIRTRAVVPQPRAHVDALPTPRGARHGDPRHKFLRHGVGRPSIHGMHDRLAVVGCTGLGLEHACSEPVVDDVVRPGPPEAGTGNSQTGQHARRDEEGQPACREERAKGDRSPAGRAAAVPRAY